MKDTISEDTSLLFAMQQGDRSAFDRLFQKYYALLCTYCYRFVRLEDAEEIVQDVMLWLWENRERPVIEYSLKQYLFKSVYHRSMTRVVQNEVKQRADAAYYERMYASLQDADVLLINELSKHIQKAIDELPPSYKEAFIMHRFRNLSYKEIAEVLDVSPKTVDYRIQQALKILRVKLKDYLPILLSLLMNIALTKN
ncbi:RNA polymerase sigma-70 factor [Bacteroides sp. GD17]|jgi:RNA polymerase sigma-70 factor (ECF subfamily)|uniref:RNA polymerase sigma-70 factor n=1 Tax=Bacteroides sp. GD17 TaxID=3139826 RepID=UPI0025EE144A|nr:RNA polymerase sigma-70 factor [uncultured Bacteroides sp.]